MKRQLPGPRGRGGLPAPAGESIHKTGGTHEDDFMGTDSFTYMDKFTFKGTDGDAESKPAVVTITMTTKEDTHTIEP